MKEEKYNSGADMWREYAVRYGEQEALGICNRYLDLQLRSKDSEEIKFCKELYAAMKQATLVKSFKNPSLLGKLDAAKQMVTPKSATRKTTERQTER